MKIFTALYDRVMSWSQHPKATWYLGGLSFAESSFFPIPPDVLLMPMCLARPQRAYFFAWITTIASLAGGVLGYTIGYWMLELVWPFIESVGGVAQYRQVEQFFHDYGVWVVFVAGFSPIPYKLFTLAAGATNMMLLPFLVASFVGRGARFFLVATLMKFGGERYEKNIRNSVDWIGYALIMLVGLYIIYKQVG